MDEQRTPDVDRFPELSEWEGWLRGEPTADLPAVSADFVDRALRHVRDEAFGLLLAAYRVPEPSADFVARTATAVHEANSRWQRTLAGYRVPRPSRDFVERTLAALGIARRQPLRLWTLRRAAAVALVALGLGAAAAWWWSRPQPEAASVAFVPDADDHSPAPWATALARLSTTNLRLVLPDPLLLATLDEGN